MQHRIRAIELKHDIVCAGLHRSIALRTQGNLVSDDVPQITRRKHRSFHERECAIVDHSLVLTIDQADREFLMLRPEKLDVRVNACKTCEPEAVAARRCLPN